MRISDRSSDVCSSDLWEHGDCGLACVAMVAGVPYERALEAFRSLDGQKTTKNFYTNHKQVEAMLKYLGHKSERIRFQSWHSISQNAIVKVNAKKSGSWHWVVYDSGRQFDAEIGRASCRERVCQ